MYKCVDCGIVFENPESWLEDRGEFWGVSCSERVYGCPKCRGDYEEAEKCGICEELFFLDELYGGVCKECLYSNSGDAELWLKIGNAQKNSIKINSFLSDMFTEGQIEEILTREMRILNNIKNIDCSFYIDEDPHWCGEKLLKEVKK